MVRERRGIALLITLSVIASMLALVGVMFTYLETARNKAEKKSSVIQATLLRADLQQALDTLLKGKVEKNTLTGLYSAPLYLREKNIDGFRVSAACSPLLDRVRLSWLGWEGKEGKEPFFLLAKDLFDTLCDRAELKEPDRLFRMIVNTLHGREERYGIVSELSAKKGIISSNSFTLILDEYRFRTDDPNVEKIEWSRYFTFADPPGEPAGIDGDFIRPEVLAYLYGMELPTVRSAYQPGDLDKTLQELGEEKKRFEWLFMKKNSSATECTVDFGLMESDRTIHLSYYAGHIEDFELEK
jgi:hypothetical protein